MKLKHARRGGTALELAIGFAAFMLALFLIAGGDSFSAYLGAIRWELAAAYLLICGAIVFLDRAGRLAVKFTFWGVRTELDLLAALRRLMTVFSVLALLVSSVYTVKHLPPGEADVSAPAVPAREAVNNPAPDPVAKAGETAAGPAPAHVRGTLEPEILANTRIISHAMGALDGSTYLNCLEAFEQTSAQGVRVFEVDFALTADGEVVLRHGWGQDIQAGVSTAAVPTLEEFLALPILGKYTPLSLRDLLLLMEEYPDICIVTDSKYTNTEIALMEFHKMTGEAEELGLSGLLDRVIIQGYSEEMITALKNACPFPHYIFTLYRTKFDQTVEAFRKNAEFCAANHVMGITMWDYWWDPAFAPIAEEYGLSVYVHTVNDPEAARELLASGVSAVYTDELTDDILTGQAG